MDIQSESVHIGDDDDLEILESMAPNDSVKYDSEKPFKKNLKQPALMYGKFFQNVVLIR